MRRSARLGLQHRAWRDRVLAAWRLAGIGPGHRVLDLGCGPGFASLDLAGLVSPGGHVVAVDMSQRFLTSLKMMCRERGVANIATHQADLDAREFPDVMVDRVWCRWVLAFVKSPRGMMERLTAALRPGGVVVLHEYFDYSTWRATPPCVELEEFVRAVMASWRASGGEPDIALPVLGWLDQYRFELRSVRPIVDIVQPGHVKWAWLKTFIDVGRRSHLASVYTVRSRSWRKDGHTRCAGDRRGARSGIPPLRGCWELISGLRICYV